MQSTYNGDTVVVNVCAGVELLLELGVLNVWPGRSNSGQRISSPAWPRTATIRLLVAEILASRRKQQSKIGYILDTTWVKGRLIDGLLGRVDRHGCYFIAAVLRMK